MDNDIKLTDRAIKEALRMSAEDQNKGKILRLYLDGKGCDGFYYGVAFSQKMEGDLIFHSKAIAILIDQDSFKFCNGSIIDWVDDERGTGFLVENPNHKKFRGKFYKRKAWQEFLES